MKKYILFIIILAGFEISAQVKFESFTQIKSNQDAIPNANLDMVKSTEAILAEGFSIPKMTISNLYAQQSLYNTEQQSILVYVTDVTAPTGVTADQIIHSQISEIRKVGFHYFDASSNKWKSFNTDYGYGSFTPKPVQIPIPADKNASWWDSYKNSDINYFEIITGAPNQQSISLPAPVDFKNRTIYINNATGANLTFVNLPKNLDSSYPANSLYQDLGQLTFLESVDVLQLYSDGSRWYLTGGKQ